MSTVKHPTTAARVVTAATAVETADAQAIAALQASVDYLLGELLQVSSWCSAQLGIDANDELARRHLLRRATTRPGTNPAVDKLRARGRGAQ